LEGREQKPAVAVRLLETAEGERVVLCKSDGRKQKEQAIYSGAEKRFVAAMEKLDQRLRVGGVKDLGKAQQRVGKLLGRHPRVQRFYTVRLHEAEKPRSGLFYQRNESRYEEDSELFGCYVLRTARKDLDAGQLWKLYMRLSQAEEGFCALKSDLGLRPNFHQKEKRVDAHIFITVLAYHAWKWIVHTLRQAGDPRDWVTVRRVLQTHCYATVQLKTREGKVYHLRKPGIAETRQEELYKLFRVRVEGLPKSQQVVEADMKMKL
jgi:transposase